MNDSPALLRAVGYNANLPADDPASLLDVEVPVPALQPHDLLVEVHAVSVNPVDVKEGAHSDPHGRRADPRLRRGRHRPRRRRGRDPVRTRRRGLLRRRHQPARWRCVNAPHLVALVRAGARFECGKLVERAQEEAA